MDINGIYNFLDPKFSPLVRYLFISPPDEILDMLRHISMKYGIMRENHGFEFEDDNTVTFWDFSSDPDKSCNLTLSDLLSILEPQIIQGRIYERNPEIVDVIRTIREMEK